MKTSLVAVLVAAGITVSAPVFAARDHARFVGACMKATNLEKTTCTCVEKKADARLSDDGFNFLIASFEGDEARAETLRNRMKMSEITESSMFMVVAPRDCAAEGK